MSSTVSKVVCVECGEEVANSWMTKHILKCHCRFATNDNG